MIKTFLREAPSDDQAIQKLVDHRKILMCLILDLFSVNAEQTPSNTAKLC